MNELPGTELLDYSCSFCGKPQRDVEVLIKGPAVYICSECLELCTQMLADEREKRAERLTQGLVDLESQNTEVEGT